MLKCQFNDAEILASLPELKKLPPRHQKFRANRSMRDVEPEVNLWLKTLDGIDITEDSDDQAE